MMINEYLTTREKEVGIYLISGMTAKKISRQLGISIHTIEGYQRKIKRKLKAKTPYEVGYLLGRSFEKNQPGCLVDQHNVGSF
jgi:DNA-binding CsgD family transcriptional regulator